MLKSPKQTVWMTCQAYLGLAAVQKVSGYIDLNYFAAILRRERTFAERKLPLFYLKSHIIEVYFQRKEFAPRVATIDHWWDDRVLKHQKKKKKKKKKKKNENICKYLN